MSSCEHLDCLARFSLGGLFCSPTRLFVCCYLQAATRSSGRGELRVFPWIWKFESPLTNPFEKNLCSHFHLLFSSRWYNSLSLFFTVQGQCHRAYRPHSEDKKVVRGEFWSQSGWHCGTVAILDRNAMSCCAAVRIGRKVDWRCGAVAILIVTWCPLVVLECGLRCSLTFGRKVGWRCGAVVSRRESTRCFQLCWQYVKRARLHTHYYM